MTNCSFPAEALIREMRRVCAIADATDDIASIGAAARYVHDTNLLRHDHEDVMGCQCWYEAVKRLKKEARTN
jgi:hypothetical protein